MKLLYVWFKRHKKLKEFEANFGSEYLFDFECSKKCISIKKNISYINDFFKLPNNKFSTKKNILNVTAIVGENGSGKSTVLDFIGDLMRNKVIRSEYILVYSINGKLHLTSSYNKEITISSEIFGLKLCISPVNFQEHLSLLFSNVFDARSIETQSENEVFFKDITTNFLVKESINTSNFLLNEFEKQVYFIHEYKDQLDIQNLMRIPDKIFVDNQLNTDFNHTDELDEILNYLQDDFGIDTVDDLLNYPAPNDFYEKFYLNCLKSFFIHMDLLINEYNIPFSSLDYSTYLFHFSKENYSNFFHFTFKHIKDELPNNIYNDFLNELSDLSKNFHDFCEIFGKMEFNFSENLPYIITDNSKTKTFISLYQNTFTKNGCLGFTWSEMSSGEYGMLCLFSRFHHTLKVLKHEYNLFFEETDYSLKINKNEMGVYKFNVTNYKFPTSYLLLIDEGDLYFHPQWQKEWLIYFIKLAELIFTGHIQIILTTHSPFVLSDFPNTNVIFLKNNTFTNTNSSYLEGSTRTFASNIIELFSNSFFMKDGLIGSFAKEKTNHFIHWLLSLSPEETYIHKTEIKKFIDVIGEPLIRNKVLQIYNEKLELYNENDLEHRILILEEELNKLRRGKN